MDRRKLMFIFKTWCMKLLSAFPDVIFIAIYKHRIYVQLHSSLFTITIPKSRQSDFR